MTRKTTEADAFAGKRAPEDVQKLAMKELQNEAVGFVRMALNPLSYVPQPLIPLLSKWNPWLALFT